MNSILQPGLRTCCTRRVEPFTYREEGPRKFLARAAFLLVPLVAMALVTVAVSVKAAL